MPGLTPQFTNADINKHVDAFVKDKLKRMFETLSFVGIEAVNYAKEHGSYQDQTGNLRSSVGYAVIYNGNIQKQSMSGRGEGVSAGKELIDELAEQFNQGMVLVVVAGMEYAAAVESLNFDVITGSSFAAEELLTFLRQKLGATFQ